MDFTGLAGLGWTILKETWHWLEGRLRRRIKFTPGSTSCLRATESGVVRCTVPSLQVKRLNSTDSKVVIEEVGCILKGGHEVPFEAVHVLKGQRTTWPRPLDFGERFEAFMWPGKAQKQLKGKEIRQWYVRFSDNRVEKHSITRSNQEDLAKFMDAVEKDGDPADGENGADKLDHMSGGEEGSGRSLRSKPLMWSASIPEVFCGTPEGCIRWKSMYKSVAASTSKG